MTFQAKSQPHRYFLLFLSASFPQPHPKTLLPPELSPFIIECHYPTPWPPSFIGYACSSFSSLAQHILHTYWNCQLPSLSFSQQFSGLMSFLSSLDPSLQLPSVLVFFPQTSALDKSIRLFPLHILTWQILLKQLKT